MKTLPALLAALVMALVRHPTPQTRESNPENPRVQHARPPSSTLARPEC